MNKYTVICEQNMNISTPQFGVLILFLGFLFILCPHRTFYSSKVFMLSCMRRIFRAFREKSHEKRGFSDSIL